MVGGYGNTKEGFKKQGGTIGARGLLAGMEISRIHMHQCSLLVFFGLFLVLTDTLAAPIVAKFTKLRKAKVTRALHNMSCLYWRGVVFSRITWLFWLKATGAFLQDRPRQQKLRIITNMSNPDMFSIVDIISNNFQTCHKQFQQ